MIKVSNSPDLYMGWFPLNGRVHSLCAELLTNGKVNPGSIRVGSSLYDMLESVKCKKWFLERVSSIADVNDLPGIILNTISEIAQSTAVSGEPIESNPQLIMSEIDAVGWEHFVGVSDDLRTVNLTIRDNSQRLHEVELHFPENYPDSAPAVSLSAPFMISVDWTLQRNVPHILTTIEREVNAHDAFYNVMVDIDSHTIVLEPSPPSFRFPYRRIALSRSASVKVVINVNKPLEVCEEISFMGPPLEVAPYRTSLSKKIHLWSPQRTVRRNLELILDAAFPQLTGDAASAADNTSFSSECGICYAYLLPSGDGSSGASVSSVAASSIPDQLCPNEKCARLYHFDCLVSWLQSVPTNKSSFGTLFGNCPYCQGAISARTFG